MSAKKIHKTPSGYLAAATVAMAPIMKAAGFPMKMKKGCADFTVTLSFPNKGGTRASRRVVGQAWSARACGDRRHAVMVSPSLPVKTKEQRIQALGVLLHEVIHVTVGLEHGHKGDFRECARAAGLEGPLTATTVGKGSDLHRELGKIAASLGAPPWGKIDFTDQKKQRTRMVKIQCDDCGLIFRTAGKWVQVMHGDPQCPDRACGGTTTVG